MGGGRRSTIKEQWLTARSNNILSIALGLAILVYIIVVQASDVLGESGRFSGLLYIGGAT